MSNDIHWKLGFDINLPTNGSVKVHYVEWADGVLNVYVSNTDDVVAKDQYVGGTPLYEEDDDDYPVLIGMNPHELGDPPQTLVKDWHLKVTQNLL